MNYFDPIRPRGLNGKPFYLGKDGHPISALQDLTVELNPPGASYEATVRVMLRVGRAEFKWFEFETNLRDLSMLFMLYRDEPEHVLEKYFGYPGCQAEPQAEPSGGRLFLNMNLKMGG